MVDGKRDPLRIVGKNSTFFPPATRDAMERLKSVDEIVDMYAVEASSLKQGVHRSWERIRHIRNNWDMDTRMANSIAGHVPHAFLFSLSSKRLFRWSLTNRFFGPAMFDFYASGKTIPRHAKYGIALMISLMTILSTYGVWAVSTRGDGTLLDPSTWNGADRDMDPQPSSLPVSSASGTFLPG